MPQDMKAVTVALNQEVYDWFVDRFPDQHEQLFTMILSHFYDSHHDDIDGLGLKTIQQVHDELLYKDFE